MDKKGIRIISLEARELFKQIQDNGEDVGYILPAKKSNLLKKSARLCMPPRFAVTPRGIS